MSWVVFVEFVYNIKFRFGIGREVVLIGSFFREKIVSGFVDSCMVGIIEINAEEF